MTANVANNIQDELESQSKAEILLEKYKQVEKELNLKCVKIGKTYICCKNEDRLPLYEKSIKTINIVQSNENL